MSAVIAYVEENTIASEIGLEPGDKIISVNGEKFDDILEFRFLTKDDYIELEVERKNGELIIFEIDNYDYEDIGVEFENPLIDKPRSCRNKCIFCFIDQLPKGLRKPLYFKDDDTRLSFLDGNYVTLTNMSDEEIDRVIKIRLSPINISVHTTNDNLRCFMLGNRFAGGILDKIKKFYRANLTVNCQIVLVKGINDEEELIKTVSDLSSLYPCVNSISVVPVGISDHREGLFKVEPFDRYDSLKVIGQIKGLQEENLKKYGSRIVYIADEFYINAGVDFPPCEDYDGFPQIENGVGMMASFLSETEAALLGFKNIKGRKTVVTGKLAYPYFKKIAEKIKERAPEFTLNVVMGINTLFGEKITVTGLLPGRDILRAIKGEKNIGEAVLLCKNTLRAEQDMFLDNMTPKELQKEAGVKIVFCEDNGKDFVDKLMK